MCDCSLTEINERVKCCTVITRGQSWIHTRELSTEWIHQKQEPRIRGEEKTMSLLLFLPLIPRFCEDGGLTTNGGDFQMSFSRISKSRYWNWHVHYTWIYRLSRPKAAISKNEHIEAWSGETTWPKSFHSSVKERGVQHSGFSQTLFYLLLCAVPPSLNWPRGPRNSVCLRLWHLLDF